MLVNMLHITVFEVPAATEPPTTTDQPTTEQSTTEPTQPIVQQDLHSFTSTSGGGCEKQTGSITDARSNIGEEALWSRLEIGLLVALIVLLVGIVLCCVSVLICYLRSKSIKENKSPRLDLGNNIQPATSELIL